MASPSEQDFSIRQYTFGAREATTRDFDEKNRAQLDLTLAELQKILAIKVLVVFKGCDIGTMARYDAFALTKSALDVLVSSVHTARQRAGVETGSLLRIALECGATAVHISQDSDAYERYKNGDYKSTRAISFTKTLIPVLGEIWGAFSEVAVHANVRGFGPKLEPDEKGYLARSIILEYASRKWQPAQDQALLTMISLVVAEIVLKMTELIVLEKSPSHEKWLRLVGTQMEYTSNTDDQITKYYEELRSYSRKHASTLQASGDSQSTVPTPTK
ncbi:MAG: hypothetical protein ABSA12_13100 [Verrucomicrobiia bacterium]|jgi:hypothetical protein